MDINAFKPDSPGQLVAIDDGERAFVPNGLPPTWRMPAGMFPLLLEARKSMALLEGIGRQVTDPELLIQPLQQLEALRSSALEGTYATPEELLLYELEPREVKSKEDPAKDWREVHNYTSALRHGLTSGLPLCKRLFREMHGHLLRNVRGEEKRPGEWRTGQVYIGSNHRFIPPPLNYLEKSLDDLEAYINSGTDEFDPLIKCFIIHYQFETIHPFTDGNGRVGRLLLSLMMKVWCEFTKPWLYMSAFFEKNKQEYIEKLFRVSSENDWNSWIEFCLRGTVAQAKDTILRCDKLRKLKEEYDSKLSSSGADVRIIELVKYLFKSPIIRITEASKLLKITYPTAKTDIERLVAMNILAELPNQPVKTFYCSEIINVAYKD